ncbi:MAG TPA: type II toxin-antitoxin system VapC family toxin [Acidobacteriaceae bacterium]
MILLDTHIAFWMAYEPEKLSEASVRQIREAEHQPDGIALSAASIYELAWLIERGRIKPADRGFLHELIERFLIFPVDGRAAQNAAMIPQSFHGDPMDRLIVTAAMQTGRILISADRLIQNAGLCKVVW